jgi:CSLREA domain-containing protein
MSLAKWLRRRSNASPVKSTRRLSFRPTLECLESREVPAVYVVNSAADISDGDVTDHIADIGNATIGYTGICTLRAAIEQASYNYAHFGETAVIDFAIGIGPATIALGSNLPLFTGTIDGTTQPGFSGTPIIELVGAGASIGVGVSTHSTVTGLSVCGFPGTGLYVGGDSNSIDGNYVGLTPTGAPDGNGDGITVLGGFNMIGGAALPSRNIISGNMGAGINLAPGSHDNTTVNNYIGVDSTGEIAVANGIGVCLNGMKNVVGGMGPPLRNIISDNAAYGVEILGGSFNQVVGDYIGVDATGMMPLGNGGDGVHFTMGASLHTVGGTVPGAGNVISGNGGNGVGFETFCSSDLIAGNFIGTDFTGSVAIGNGKDGVAVPRGHGILIGGTVAAARNVISGNMGDGVAFSAGTAPGNLVQGNFIGTNATGVGSLGNGGDGISITDAPSNTVGGASAGTGNVISGNLGDGILITGTGSTSNSVLGDFIGVKASGGGALGNLGDGVAIKAGAASNNIGGSTAGAMTVIASGVGSILGLATPQAGNLISGNSGDGILIDGSSSDFNLVLGNFIGTSPDGTAKLANTGDGVFFNGAPLNTVGGSTPGVGNLISGNTGVGVFIDGATATADNVQGDFIGAKLDGAGDLGNGSYGVLLDDGAHDNRVGSMIDGGGDTIAFNGGMESPAQGFGILVRSGTGNMIRRDSIFSNHGRGIALSDAAWSDVLNDLGDADVGPNNLQNYPVLTSVKPIGGNLMISGFLNSNAGQTYTLEFFANDEANDSGFGDGKTFLGDFQVTTDAKGHVDFMVPLASKGSGKLIAATATNTATGDTSGFSMVDTDGDGLADKWESRGIDVNEDGTVDLQLNSDPNHKDVFVEVDAMSGRAPTQATLNRVVDAFAAAPNSLVNNPDGADGVTLHATLDETNIALQDFPNGFTEFDAIKASRFGTAAERAAANSADILKAKKLAYRYCIFANTYDGGTSSGLAKLPGNEFMVTLGGWPTAGGTADQQAGTFMHELGHTLGLHHGGGDDVNYKPNYHSVMNYMWQVPAGYNGWTLDYSRVRLPDLDENNLDENAGIGGSVGAQVPVGGLTAERTVAEHGQVDWNGNDSKDETGVIADINGDGKFTVLSGFEDWSHLQYYFLEVAAGAPDKNDEDADTYKKLSHIMDSPTVKSVVVNDGSIQRSEVRSIAVTFSGPVTFAGANAAAAFQLNHIQDNNNVALTSAVSTNGSGQTVVTLTFSGSETDPISSSGSANPSAGPSLADGRYQLTIDGTIITGVNGVALDGAGNGTAGSSYVSPTDTYLGNGLHLYRLFGDASGDGVVDATDVGQLKSTFNRNNTDPLYLWYLDADNSGAVDAQDIGQFKSRFNANVFG